MTTNLRRFALSLLLLGGVAACAKDKHQNSPSEEIASTGAENDLARTDAEDVNDTESARAFPTTRDNNVPSEPGPSLPQVAEPTERTSDVPGVVDPTLPPSAPSQPGMANTTTGTSGTANTTAQTGTANNTGATAPDNTGVNKRDRGDKTLTPMDQGNNDKDLKITARIRETVMDDDNLSFTAKNVKIITVGGRVTLRGPVRSDKERDAIERAAVAVVGQGQVANELEVR